MNCARTVDVDGKEVKGPELETLGLLGGGILNTDRVFAVAIGMRPIRRFSGLSFLSRMFGSYRRLCVRPNSSANSRIRFARRER